MIDDGKTEEPAKEISKTMVVKTIRRMSKMKKNASARSEPPVFDPGLYARTWGYYSTQMMNSRWLALTNIFLHAILHLG